MPKPPIVFVAFLAVAIMSPLAARASWYARMENGSKVSSCVQFAEPLDTTWATLNQRFGVKCELVNDVKWRVVANAFRCGEAGLQLFFRTHENCESFKATANAGHHANVADYAPAGLRNPDGWIVAFDGCYENAALPENIATIGLQRITDYCVCISTRLANYKDRELTAAIAARAVEACTGKDLPASMSRMLKSAMNRGKKKAAHLPASTDSRRADEFTIRTGDSYALVMERLSAFSAKKSPYGDFLDADYKDPALLAYPDAGGFCRLSFTKGRLSKCSGCNPERFKCEN